MRRVTRYAMVGLFLGVVASPPAFPSVPRVILAEDIAALW
jgi:hypothetical protein